jgi:hypothetical protein
MKNTCQIYYQETTSILKTYICQCAMQYCLSDTFWQIYLKKVNKGFKYDFQCLQRKHQLRDNFAVD